MEQARLNPREAESLLVVQGLSKSFAGVKAVDSLSFAISDGEIVGLIGPNGSGKSTTIDCLTGFVRPDSGSTMLAGHDISGASPERVACLGMVRTFQNVRVYDRMPLIENLLMSNQGFDGVDWWAAIFDTMAARESESRARKRGIELLELIGIAHYAEAPASILSYGQKKLLALAMALMPKPRLIVLDEPLAGVNPTVIREISRIIARLNELGQSFLIIEHNVGFILEHCDRIIVLEQGSKIAEGPASLIREDDRVLQAYLGSADAVAKELVYHGH